MSNLGFYFVQAFVVPILTLGLCFFLEEVVGWGEITGSPFGPIGIQIVRPIVLAISAYLVGHILGRKAPTKACIGRFLFVPFVFVLAVGICLDLIDFHFNWRVVWSELFYWEHPGRDEPPLTVYFVTYPALVSLAYSFACWSATRRRNSQLDSGFKNVDSETRLNID